MIDCFRLLASNFEVFIIILFETSLLQNVYNNKLDFGALGWQHDIKITKSFSKSETVEDDDDGKKLIHKTKFKSHVNNCSGKKYENQLHNFYFVFIYSSTSTK